MRLNPHYPPFYLFELGWAYRLTGRYAEAVTALEETISQSPNFPPAHFNLAASYVEQVPHLKPLYADRHLDSGGSAYYLAGRPQEAIAPLQQYLTYYPNILGAHRPLAAVYRELGKEEEARVALCPTMTDDREKRETAATE